MTPLKNPNNRTESPKPEETPKKRTLKETLEAGKAVIKRAGKTMSENLSKSKAGIKHMPKRSIALGDNTVYDKGGKV